MRLMVPTSSFPLNIRYSFAILACFLKRSSARCTSTTIGPASLRTQRPEFLGSRQSKCILLISASQSGYRATSGVKQSRRPPTMTAIQGQHSPHSPREFRPAVREVRRNKTPPARIQTGQASSKPLPQEPQCLSPGLLFYDSSLLSDHQAKQILVQLEWRPSPLVTSWIQATTTIHRPRLRSLRCLRRNSE